MVRNPRSLNLRKSLSHDTPGTERIAFLYFDPITEPEALAAQVSTSSSARIELREFPDEVDVLWILIGPVHVQVRPPTGLDQPARTPDRGDRPVIRERMPAEASTDKR